ncbi:MAG: hypothetical protein IJ041_07185 [Clostridia bacterium]|nr:hypothetical protein [Clostridia bacterium]
MMKKWLAALLSLLLCTLPLYAPLAEAAPAAAADNWYLDTALYLADQMGLLADNEAYVELFIGMGEDTDGFADTMAQLRGLEPDQVVVYLLRENALEELAKAYQMDEISTKLAQPVMDTITRRMGNSLADLLNGHVGGNLWLAISNALAYTETYIMPDSFVPCALFLRYEGQEAAVLVTFTQTGTDTITATATYVRADAVEDEVAQTYLNLMWECASDLP